MWSFLVLKNFLDRWYLWLLPLKVSFFFWETSICCAVIVHLSFKNLSKRKSQEKISQQEKMPWFVFTLSHNVLYPHQSVNSGHVCLFTLYSETDNQTVSCWPHKPMDALQNINCFKNGPILNIFHHAKNNFFKSNCTPIETRNNLLIFQRYNISVYQVSNFLSNYWFYQFAWIQNIYTVYFIQTYGLKKRKISLIFYAEALFFS